MPTNRRLRQITGAGLAALAVLAASCAGATGSATVRSARTSTTPAAVTSMPTMTPATTATAATTASTTTTSITAATASTTTTSTTAAAGGFVGTEATVTAVDVPYTWRAGCPVGPTQLRMLHLSYWGFDNQPHVGTMVVNAAVVSDVFKIFSILFAEHFPIYQMQPEDAYHGSDPASMAANNSSGFNCRYAVAPGPPQWSVHAYGEAIDVNTVENPYIEGGTVMPTAGAAYLNRSAYRPGMAVIGGQLVEAFAAAGWLWGGRWTGSPDYQHFSKTGG
ncbi:MAG TPA: M15 family metallopeptidase [Acidimicrobiales bacterium]|nr:M15 family metallopeptidase [Acidimicrobiales bacterium]